jgi:hypothetical protein
MKPWILAIAFAALGSGVYALLGAIRTAPSSAAPPGATAEIEPEAPSREPAPIAMNHSVRPLSTAPVAEEMADPADMKPSDDRGEPTSPPTGEEMRDHLEAAFAADPPAAARDLAQGLEDGARAALPAGSRVRSVECRASLCRIETEHAGLDDYRAFVQRAFFSHDAKQVSIGPVFANPPGEPRHGEPVVAVVYVGREGTVLPMPGAIPSADVP